MPGHLTRRKYRPFACTYIAFSPQGNELLANIGGEQIYLFEINKKVKPVLLDIVSNSSDKFQPTNGLCRENTSKSAQYTIYRLSQNLPPKVNSLKIKGNQLFESFDYHGAVEMYNLALKYCPNAAVLYGNRAQALMKRKWDGDIYAALKDCHEALQLDRDFFRAYFRLIRCLYDLRRYQEAYQCYEQFKLKFPEQANASPACLNLEKEIKNEIKEDTKKENDPSDSDNKGDRDSWSSPRRKNRKTINSQEQVWRSAASDYKQRFCGHCNTTTDIKEANFFGK